MLRFIWASAWKDVARARRDPFGLLVWIAIPLVLGGLITAVFGGAAVTPQGRLLVADEDDTFISNVVTEAFSREPLSKMVFVEKVSREVGRARIDRGDGSALLIIPKGLSDAVLRNEPARLQLFTNPAQRILPRIVEEFLSVLVEGEFYLRQVAGNELNEFSRPQERGRVPTDADIVRYSVSIKHLVESLRKYLNPPVIQLDTVVAKENTSGKSFASVLYPTFIFMSILFTSSALAGDIWKEKNAGTLRRLYMTQTPLPAFLAGRLLFVVMVFATVALSGVSVARWLANVPVANFPGAVLWLVFSGTCFFTLLLWVVMQASTQRGANTVSNLVVFPISMIGGSFFPFEQMPEWMVRIGSKTPNGAAVLQFNAILDGSVHGRSLALVAAALIVSSVLAFALVSRKLREFAL